MTTQGDKIFNSSGQEVELKGVNWFGFNNEATMVDGLWSGSGPLASDFATVVYRMQLLGINAVRLPFSFKDLYKLSPRNLTKSCQLTNAKRYSGQRDKSLGSCRSQCYNSFNDFTTP